MKANVSISCATVCVLASFVHPDRAAFADLAFESWADPFSSVSSSSDLPFPEDRSTDLFQGDLGGDDGWEGVFPPAYGGDPAASRSADEEGRARKARERKRLKERAEEAGDVVRRRLSSARGNLDDLGRKADDVADAIAYRSPLVRYDWDDLESRSDDARGAVARDFRAIQSEIDDLRSELDSADGLDDGDTRSARDVLDDLEWKVRSTRSAVRRGLDDLEETIDEAGWAVDKGASEWEDDLSSAGDDLESLGTRTRRTSCQVGEDFGDFGHAIDAGDAGATRTDDWGAWGL